ncbi:MULTISPECIES: N-acetyl-gamma-glutamyl-phosphate reductase [Chitinophaga]|uniref:N-acetyl-gamma-glutamyl-phosphate reductase n=1 Tax=Chitinophaga TaxID=79328 RepID=UPI000DBA2515|nr:N-acetyl-gamma-glutamyl-phosphate reductase [Chitinophaga ginsengisegetis]MDR6569719.1 N-acetyl-gamma-glutamyl-phosphate reductase [Chitinophaga ginsengisegetis]MDR6649452.1 N-acetyl-gamma-glutamyl-phosphate reductase [Chitinophaga ginsengisegetis]MDR6655802.1 N-acetyl-gamma-glutamyl-phosphate reductase [Chitinophaga ginsengisegetis]
MANDKKIRAGIVGGAGYTGGEMIRLLLNHPDVTISFVHSRSNAGNPLYAVHADLLGETEQLFTGDLSNDIDVMFLCLGHGESKKFLEANEVAAHVKVIDLSQDFRLGETVKDRAFVYGLPEMQRDLIKTAQNIANPGCFATGIQLGLLPLAKAGLLTEVHTTGITGSTGAGQSLQATSHFTWRANNISTYKVLNHQHLKEIRRSLQLLQPGFNGEVNFVPVRGDYPRGIWVTSYLQTDLSLEEAVKLYKDFYAGHPFTHVSDKQIDLKQVVNTNKCLIQLEKTGNKLVIHSIEDNLLKGASGQAVQNMNLMCGLDETAGLKLKSIVF